MLNVPPSRESTIEPLSHDRERSSKMDSKRSRSVNLSLGAKSWFLAAMTRVRRRSDVIGGDNFPEETSDCKAAATISLSSQSDSDIGKAKARDSFYLIRK